MANLKFYIKDSNAKINSAILVVLYYEGYRMKTYTGLNVPPKYWNPKKQRVKEVMDFSDGYFLNEQLDRMEEAMNSLLRKYRDLGYFPKPEKLKKEFRLLEGNPIKDKRDKNWWDFFEEFIEYKTKELVDIRDYNNSLRKHLMAIERRMDMRLSFELLANPESNFAEDWNRYMLYEAINNEGNEGLAVNYAGKLNKNLKVFLNWCFDRNVVSRFSLKKFPAVQEEVDKVYVTEEELEMIEKLNLVCVQEKLVRDLFLIGCETGLRFSDFIRIETSDIQNNQIHFRPKKTRKQANNKVIIPISARLDTILSNYNYHPPTFNGKRITQFNSTLRNVCEKAGLTSEISRYRLIGGNEVKEVKLKYEEVSSHTCRRTFCTLKFLKGMPAQAIMKFSGHKTERNFLKYLKLDAELTASKYVEYF